MNIVEVRQGAGVFVAALDIDSLTEPLAFAVSIEKAALRSLVEARLVLEPGIAALAAARASDEDLEAVARIVADSRQLADKDPKRFLESDIELHASIIRMCGNAFLVRIMESVGRLARSSRDFTNAIPRMRADAQVDHEAILSALLDRDPDAVHEAMRHHLEHVASTLSAESRDGRDGRAPDA
jgi:DNA-binding FadR family transcriptional regulator